MVRGIFYVPGAGHHIFNQSGALVADRIARALQCKLATRLSFHYRVTPKSDFRRFEDIPIDIATIEVKRRDDAEGSEWQKLIDVIELRYLPRFTKPVSDRSPLGRAAFGLRVLLAAAVAYFTGIFKAIPVLASGVFRCMRLPREEDKRSNHWQELQDVWQASLYNLWVSSILIRAVVFWTIVGIAATGIGVLSLFSAELVDILKTLWEPEPEINEHFVHAVLSITIIALTLTIYYLVRKNKIEADNRVAEEALAAIEYNSKPGQYLDVLNAILDATTYLVADRYNPVNILSLSLGAILTADAIFPRKSLRPAKRSPSSTQSEDLPSPARPVIESWVTIGFPYQLVERGTPGYFAKRQSPMLDFATWHNVWIRYDYLSSRLATENRRIGFADTGQPNFRPKKDNDWEFCPPNQRKPHWTDLFVLRRQQNHCLFWDDTNARAPTCFEDLVERLCWAKDVENLLAPERKFSQDC